MVGSHNNLIVSHEALQAEVLALRDKVSNLEDGSRHKVKIRGTPETVSTNGLHDYTVDLYIAPTKGPVLLIDRLPRPRNAPEGAPRDILMRMHYFHVKESLLKAARLSAESSEIPGTFNYLETFLRLHCPKDAPSKP